MLKRSIGLRSDVMYKLCGCIRNTYVNNGLSKNIFFFWKQKQNSCLYMKKIYRKLEIKSIQSFSTYFK